MSRLTDAQMRCLGEILQNAYDAGGNDARKQVHRRTFGQRQLSHMVGILNDADRFESLTESRDKTSEIKGLANNADGVTVAQKTCNHRLPVWCGDIPNGPQFWCRTCGSLQLNHGQWRLPLGVKGEGNG